MKITVKWDVAVFFYLEIALCRQWRGYCKFISMKHAFFSHINWFRIISKCILLMPIFYNFWLNHSQKGSTNEIHARKRATQRSHRRIVTRHCILISQKRIQLTGKPTWTFVSENRHIYVIVTTFQFLFCLDFLYFAHKRCIVMLNIGHLA